MDAKHYRVAVVVAFMAMGAVASLSAGIWLTSAKAEPDGADPAPGLTPTASPPAASPPVLVQEEVRQVRLDQPPRAGTAAAAPEGPEEDPTFIRAIYLDLASPMHAVTLEWEGPRADRMPVGPFHSSPGAGLGDNDCNDFDESNRKDSNCTPKGDFTVQAFSDYLPSYPFCRHVTWFHLDRGIAFHSHFQLPRYPASHGCVRMADGDAWLIHENSVKDVTTVHVTGEWSGR